MTREQLNSIATELEGSLAYKLGWAHVVRPTKRLREIVKAMPGPVPPPVVTATIPSAFRGKGALSVNVGALAGEAVQRAGIIRLAVQITSLEGDNDSTRENRAAIASLPGRFPGVLLGGWGTHGGDPAVEARNVYDRIRSGGLQFYVADTERHKLRAEQFKTEQLLFNLRTYLGRDFPIACVTFGWSQFSQGQSNEVNYAAMIKYGATYMPEAYDEGGRSIGINNLVSYLKREAVMPPYVVAIGDKSVESDVIEMEGVVASSLMGVWAYAPEQSDQLAELRRI
jgi:hypothetical protein